MGACLFQRVAVLVEFGKTSSLDFNFFAAVYRTRHVAWAKMFLDAYISLSGKSDSACSNENIA